MENQTISSNPETHNNVKVVREFFNHDTTKNPTTQEFMDFWKACTIEERQQYGDQARSLMATA
jgi:hypothetical protein